MKEIITRIKSGCKSITLNGSGHHPIFIIAGRARVTRKESVVDKIGWNRFCGCRMGLHKFLVVCEDCVEDRVNETFRQILGGDDKII